MKEKNTVTVSLGTVICVIIMLVLIIALILMYLYYNSDLKNTNNLNTSEKIENNINHEINNEQIKKISKLDESKDIVYTSYSKYSSEYSYSIPYININSDDVSKINKEIETYYKDIVEEELKNESKGLSIITYDIKYNSYINDNILSLVISTTNPNDCIDYKVYNLDIYEGTIITNTDIINMKNINETEFLETLVEAYKNEFVSTYGTKEKFSGDMRNLYEEQFNSTISTDNYSIQTPIFLNENAKISVIGRIYSLAGADYYEHIIDTNI